MAQKDTKQLVESYIQKLKQWQEEIKRLRQIVQKTDLEEDYKKTINGNTRVIPMKVTTWLLFKSLNTIARCCFKKARL